MAMYLINKKLSNIHIALSLQAFFFFFPLVVVILWKSS